MKRFKLKNRLRMAIMMVNALILIIWSGFVFFWYMTITGDIPPTPTVEELLTLNKFVSYWLLILIGNIVFVVFSTNKSTL